MQRDRLEEPPMISVTLLLLVLALAFTLIHAVTGKLPLWIAVLFLCLVLLMGSVVRT